MTDEKLSLNRELNLRIKKVTVLPLRGSQDQVTLDLDVPTAYPAMGYPASATIFCQEGYALEWCRLVFGTEPDEIIST